MMKRVLSKYEKFNGLNSETDPLPRELPHALTCSSPLRSLAASLARSGAFAYASPWIMETVTQKSSTVEPSKPKLTRIFGWASFYNDFGSDMVFPVWPAFVTQTLGASASFLGFLDGMGEALVAFSKLLPGILADRLRRHKLFVWLGYCGGVLGRLGYALATRPSGLIVPRVLDRLGKIRESPRDAMLAEAVPEGRRGKAFGFIRAMDHAGAAAGILCAFALLQFLHIPVRTLFAIAALPSLISVFLVLFFIAEPERKEHKQASRSNHPLPSFKFILGNTQLRKILLVFTIFGLANISYSFLLLAAHRVGWSTPLLPVLYLIFTALAALSSSPFGRLADQFGAKRTLLVSFALLGATFLIAGISTSTIGILPAFFLYGLHKGAIDPAERTLIASLAAPEQRATIFGTAQFARGVTAIPASLLAGILWDVTNAPLVSFGVATGLLIVAFFNLATLRIS
jgi:MFS family permease